jgi:hypothetical protein
VALTAEPGVAARLAAFAVVLLAVFGAAFGLGRAVGPVGSDAPDVPATSHRDAPGADHDRHGG